MTLKDLTLPINSKVKKNKKIPLGLQNSMRINLDKQTRFKLELYKNNY